ncbi:MAG TPA: hypothetical protein PKL44_00255 [Candidatus Dojkabacteria bacterium]|nr:hypothetical protein [Candidatus Dojkabacteria bacterium]
MKIQFNKPYRIEAEVVCGVWKVSATTQTVNDKEWFLLRFTPEDIRITFAFTAGPEYLRKWLREGIITIIP